MTSLERLSKKRSLLAIGLMSGTSADAMDAALVRIAPKGDGVGVRLLAFDDDREPNTSATLAEVFRRARPDGAELNLALDLARKHHPDLVLMDIQLPEVSITPIWC